MQRTCRPRQDIRIQGGWPLTNEKYDDNRQGLTKFLSGALPVTIIQGEPGLDGVAIAGTLQVGAMELFTLPNLHDVVGLASGSFR